MVWPTWRTRMLPARMLSPPKTLTPRYCAFEPRPLRVEPPPFLCAMVSALHLRNLDRRVALTMSGLLPGALALAELEHHDLLTERLADDLALDGSTLDRGCSELRLGAADEQHFFEAHLRARFTGKSIDANGLTFGDVVLLAAGADDCVGHDGARNLVQDGHPRKLRSRP